MKNKVILTQTYLPEAMDRLRQGFELIVVEGSGKEPIEVLRDHPDARALISFLSDPVGADVIEAGSRLKIIANYAVGTNNIDVAHARRKGIYVTHTPDVLTDATADLTMALILAVARRIVEADNFLRSGNFTGWKAQLLLGKELRNRTLGIVGLGRIGLATALRARAFGMRVIYYDRRRHEDLEKKYGFEFFRFVDLVKTADVVSPHIPYSDDVHHLFDRDVLGLMKPDAIFVNVSRGPIMNEEDLAEHLEQKRLFGAGLDVYEFEPRVNVRLKRLDNVVLLPHIGSATDRSRLEMALMTVRSVEQALAGQRPDYLIPGWSDDSG